MRQLIGGDQREVGIVLVHDLQHAQRLGPAVRGQQASRISPSGGLSMIAIRHREGCPGLFVRDGRPGIWPGRDRLLGKGGGKARQAGRWQRRGRSGHRRWRRRGELWCRCRAHDHRGGGQQCAPLHQISLDTVRPMPPAAQPRMKRRPSITDDLRLADGATA